MRALWADERVTFEGDYYRTDDFTIYDRPEGGLPIYVAAGGPVIAKYAGRSATASSAPAARAWTSTPTSCCPPSSTGSRRASDPSTPDRPDDRDQAVLRADPRRGDARTPASGRPCRSSPEDKHRLDDPLEMAYAADKLPIEEVAARWIVETTPEGVVEAVPPLRRGRLRPPGLHAPGADQQGFLTAFGRDVLPLLRQL